MYNTLWVTFLTALVLSLAITPIAIKLAPKVGAIDIPKDNRRMHTKAMPRFGGLAIFAGSTVSMLIFLNFDPKIISITIGGLLIYILGITDDIRHLSPKVKFLGELVVAIVMYVNGIRIEFITNFFGSGNNQLGDALCFIITVVWIVGITNTINLIDGLDGLAASVTILNAVFFSVASIGLGNGVSPSPLAVIGSLLGFLVFNVFPARVFMGDTGSLALGGFVSGMACFLRLPLFLPLVGFIYMMEILSVILQVSFFKLTKGKRIFKMTPIHHHFELMGWSETQIVTVFATITAILCLIALMGL